MAIPGRGEPKSRAEVQAFRDNVRHADQSRRRRDQGGRHKGQLAMQVKTDDLGWQFNAGFYGSLYDELTKK